MILLLLFLIQVVSCLGADDTSTAEPSSFMSTFEFELFPETSQVLNPHATFASPSLLLPSSTNTIYPFTTSRKKEVATISINSLILPTTSFTALYSITKPVKSAASHFSANDLESKEMLHRSTAAITHILTELSLQPTSSSQVIDPSITLADSYPSMTPSKKVAAMSKSPTDSYLPITAASTLFHESEVINAYSSANDPRPESHMVAISQILTESSLQAILSSQSIDPTLADSYTVYPSIRSTREVAAISKSRTDFYVLPASTASPVFYESEAITTYSSANDPRPELHTVAISHITESSLQPTSSSQTIDLSITLADSYPSMTPSKKVSAISRSPTDSYLPIMATSTLFHESEVINAYSSANDVESREILHTTTNDILTESYNALTIASLLPVTSNHDHIFNPSLTMTTIPTTSSDDIISYSSRNESPSGSTQIIIDPMSTLTQANDQTSSQFASILTVSTTANQITPVPTLIFPSSPYDELEDFMLLQSSSIFPESDFSSKINIFTTSFFFNEPTPSSHLPLQPSNGFSSLSNLLLLTTTEEVMPFDSSTISPDEAASFIIVSSTDEFLSTLEATSSDDLFSGFFSSSDEFEPTPTLSSSIDLFSSDFLMSEYMTSFIPFPSPLISPQIVTLILGPENMTANYSETATLSCTFSSPFRLSADLIWYHDYEEINETIDKHNITTDVHESEEDYNVTTVFTLTIEDVVLEDQGYYECTIDDEEYLDIRGTAYLTIQKPPTINATEESLSIDEGGEAVLQVTVFGGVPPVNEGEVEWLFTSFDGISSDITNETCTCNITTSNEAYTLTLHSVLRTDRGNYTLAVYHPTGLHKISIELIVNVPPCAMIANYSTGIIIVNETESVELWCNVESYPELEYEIEWYSMQNGTEKLQNSSKFLIDYTIEDNETGLVFVTQSQLIITDITLYDDGAYTCSAGPQSACNATFNITVQSPPSVGSLVNGSIIYGVVSENVTIQFVLTNAGVPPILSNDTQWVFNESESLEEDSSVIFSDDRLSLTLTNLSFTNEGNYTITIANPAGTDSASLFLDVEGLLHATSREVAVAENDNVTIGFTIEGDDPIYQVDDFEWYYTNLSNITQAVVENNRLSLSNDLRSLTIISVQLEDRGNYTLEINNRRSSTVYLDVKIAPRLIYTKGENQTRNTSSSTTFNCSADGVPRPTIQWIRNGRTLFSSNRFNITSRIDNDQSIHERQAVSSYLTISDMQLQDDGNYNCKADNLFLSPASLSTDYILTVIDNRPPPFCDQNPNECGSNGNCGDLPGGGYECICNNGYSYNGEECLSDPPGVNIPPKLKRIEVKYDKELLTVHGPFPMETVQNIPAKLFSNLTMICYSEGIPQPETTWYKDGQPLTCNKRFFQILEVQQTDRGYYQCKVKSTSESQESGEFLVNITGVLAFRIRIEAEEQSNATVIVKMIRNNIINTRVGDGIVISVELLEQPTKRRKRYNRNPPMELTIVVTLFFEEEAPESQDAIRDEARESLKSEIENEGYRVVNISRFDGCPRNNTYINGTELEWPELNIGDTAIISCPCGGLDLRSTGLIASHKCGGTFETGGQWEDLKDEKCIFSETTKAICELAGKPSDEKVEQLGSLTEDVTNFEPAEVITATVVLLTTGQDAKGNFNLSKGFLNVVNNIASVNVTVLRTSQEEARVTTKLMDSLHNVSEGLPIESNDKPAILLEELFVVLVQGVDQRSFANNTFVANLRNNSLVNDSLELVDNSNGEYSNSTAFLTLPPNLFDNLALSNVSNLADKLVSIAFTDETLFLRRTSAIENKKVGSVIFSVSVANQSRIDNLTNPTVDMSFQIIKKPQAEFAVTCVYWDAKLDEGYGDWSTEGCIVNETEYLNDSSRVLCHCNHLTSFAIILDLTPMETPTDGPDHYSYTLSAITYIGTIVSTVCLLITIVTFLSVKKLRRTEHGQLLIHLSVALIGLYGIFIGSSLSIKIHVLCSMTAILLQYFFLVIFMLMAALAVDLYLKLVVVLGGKISYYVLKATIVSWVLPIFITLFSFAPDHSNFYKRNYFCRPYDIPFYVGMITPFAVIYLFNWIIFFIILVRLLLRRDVSPQEGQSKYKKIKQQLIAAIGLSVLLGLGWGMGIPASSQFFKKTPAVQKTFEVLFVSLTSFQGLAVFVMQCLRSLEARTIWSTWYHGTLKYSLQSSNNARLTISSDKGQTKVRETGSSTCPEARLNGNEQTIDGVEGQQIELLSQSPSDESNGQAEDTTETIMNPGFI